MRQGEAGLTLIEILVVLAILAVVAGSAVFVMPRDAGSASLARVSETLVTDLTRAAQIAAPLARPMTLSWTRTSYSIETGTGLETRELPSAITLRSALESPFHVTAFGLPAEIDPLVLELSNTQGSLIVQFDGLNAVEVSNAPG